MTAATGSVRGFAWPEPKWIAVGQGQAMNPERVKAAFEIINGELVIGEQFQLIEMLLNGTEFTVVEAAAPTPDAAASEAGEVLPQHIGRLHLGERRSDGERLCSHGHPVAAGQALYWPQQIGQYDDSDPLCLEHAIEQAVDDNGWCECDARAALTTQGGAEG